MKTGTGVKFEAMRVVLRIIAVGIWIAIVATILIVWRGWHFDHFVSLMANRTFGVLTIVGWGLTLTVGPFAAAQLWRLRESGRITALLVTAYPAVYYIAGWLSLRHGVTSAHFGWLPTAINVVLMVLLLSPAAQRACQPGTSLLPPAIR